MAEKVVLDSLFYLKQLFLLFFAKNSQKRD